MFLDSKSNLTSDIYNKFSRSILFKLPCFFTSCPFFFVNSQDGGSCFGLGHWLRRLVGCVHGLGIDLSGTLLPDATDVQRLGPQQSSATFIMFLFNKTVIITWYDNEYGHIVIVHQILSTKLSVDHIILSSSSSSKFDIYALKQYCVWYWITTCHVLPWKLAVDNPWTSIVHICFFHFVSKDGGFHNLNDVLVVFARI